MEDQDLREIGITDPSHRKKILHAARSLPKVTNHCFCSNLSIVLPLMFDHKVSKTSVIDKVNNIKLIYSTLLHLSTILMLIIVR